MRDKSNFDGGLATLMQYKILFAASAIVFIAAAAIGILPMFVNSAVGHFILMILITLLEMPLYFGFIKLALTACRGASPSLGQLVEFYKPALLFKALLYGLVAGVLIIIGGIGIAIVTMVAASVTRSLLLGLIAIIGCYILVLMYMIKIIPMLFIFVEQPDRGVMEALSDGWALTTGRMKDLLLIGWGLFWRSLILGIIPGLVMMAAGEASTIALIINALFTIILDAYMLAVIGSVWLELNE